MNPFTIYQAPEGYLRDLERELVYRRAEILGQKENLILAAGEEVPSAWAVSVWRNVAPVEIHSIGDGVKQLRALGKNWVLVPGAFHRRANLIAEQLASPKPVVYRFPEFGGGSGPFGQFTLWQEDLIYASTNLSVGFPEGKVQFLEDKNAPSRAYLKLWEALFRYGRVPAKGETALDLGASPGGWTYVLAGLGVNVQAVDRSELEVHLMNHPNVKFSKGDAFSLLPEKAGKVEWLFSDVICYPEKLFEFLDVWIRARAARHIICTIKFQGESDPAVVEKFQRVGEVKHLFHNKHELTFFWSEESAEKVK